MDPPPALDSFVRSRIANACDGCKARKVKCDGHSPCSYCARRHRAHTCHYSPQRRRRAQASTPRLRQQQRQQQREQQQQEQQQEQQRRQQQLPQSPSTTSESVSRPRSAAGDGPAPAASPSPVAASAVADPSAASSETPAAAPGAATPRASRTSRDRRRNHHHRQASPDDDNETEVPREARLLCDAQGKLIFIGDCAPLSFFQSVRQLVTSRVGQNAFAPQSSRYSVLENAPPHRCHRLLGDARVPQVRPDEVARAVANYQTTATGLVDLFDDDRLLDDVLLWASLDPKPDDADSVVFFLVLAIGRRLDNEEVAQDYFEYARDKAYANLGGTLSVTSIQAFVLVTLYMLCSCQINGAFLFFGIAVRMAYSIGIHRTEVNARFGPPVRRQRDRLWKSLRIVDLFLSTSMGRPPATSDVDCTVPYQSPDDGVAASGRVDLLHASVQIFLILEGVVTEIYSRRKISLQLTEGISLQLRDWSSRWLALLRTIVADPARRTPAEVSGACQVLSTYYYAVMLVSRPFLMYELCRRLSDAPAVSAASRASGKSRLADACVDAASLMVDPVLDLIRQGYLKGRTPILVSWLFAASLVLGVGLLGGFGRILEKYTRMSIEALEHCSKHDTHATQYSLIAQSLLSTALDFLEDRELQERVRRTESSSQLFGLVPSDARASPASPAPPPARGGGGVPETTAFTPASTASAPARLRDASAAAAADRSFLQHNGLQGMGSPRFGDLDAAFFGLGDSLIQTPDANYWGNMTVSLEGDAHSTLNLFTLLDAGGGIDLAHHL